MFPSTTFNVNIAELFCGLHICDFIVANGSHIGVTTGGHIGYLIKWRQSSELNVDNWNDNCEAKSEAKSPRPLRGLQVDFSPTRNVSYVVR